MHSELCNLTFFIKVVNKILGKSTSSIAVFFTTFWILALRKLGINELCKLDREGRRVVIQLDDTFRSISRPAVTNVKSIQMIKIGFHLLRVELGRSYLR